MIRFDVESFRFMSSSTGEPVPVLSIAPVILPAPGRGIDLHVRVSVPATGDALPVIIF